MNALRIAAFVAAGFVAGAAALEQVPSRVRGTITALDGNTLSVKTREGQDLKIELAPNATFAYMRKADLSEIKQGTPLGATVANGADGKLVARELHLFNPARPIPNEGTRSFDLDPNAMMTNATVSAVSAAVQSVSPTELTLSYKGGEQRVVIPAGIPIVAAVESDRSVIVAGEYAYISTTASADGKLMATRLQISKNGVKPPQ